MLKKFHSIVKRSLMLFKKVCSQRSIRSHPSLRQIFFFLFIFLLFLILILFNHRTIQICNPEEALWWFCPWPDPQTTVCSWDNHFPSIQTPIRSPEIYNDLIKSLPKRRSSFQFNNKTLIKCDEQSIDLLIFVISKCSHTSIRQTIRRTWGNLDLLEQKYPNLKVKLLFLVDIDSKSERKIELEYIYHQDLVQIVNLPEEYSYVTEREAAMYDFIDKSCQQIKYLFKTDDDIFLNTFLLLNYINKNFVKLKNENYFLYGFPIRSGLVVRHTDSYVGQRYIITKDEYSCSRYPIFLSGFGYLISLNTTKLFLNSYLTDRKPFPLSDVYFTGLLSEMFNIERKILLDKLNYYYEENCHEKYFSQPNFILTCAASNDHFKQSNQETNFMNNYNLYWTKLIHFYQF